MNYDKPDGRIEIGFSGCCCPPGADRRGRMHTNACTSWWRVVGPVNTSQWFRDNRRNHTRTLAEAANTCAEFIEAMEAKE